ncbi:MAG: xanthine dehydrogenase family protein molybdopterin-binding subunit [Acidimicrobiia bacterium]|nr:xanthine dehydrogenase family protein molybdopterin-binding subunit [Acidimicrobiia bacterium]MYG58972.1 xanthine dehydrogenase family protein molybdopterin-binding subunit [Acidimicrobiia bacterium]MYJ33125.1 xanthine dehydrogenase family protein molybdopterin-binding subunit [Acidimicrobiia bacterium]
MSTWEGRVEDFDLLTGQARFGGDLRVEGALWLGFVRSPVARATIAAIDRTAAEALDGVVGVFTADDLELITQPSVEGITPTEISRPPLAQESVAYVGEAVAAVVASCEAIAADACEMVEVDYEPLPPLSNLASATDENAPLLHARHGSNVVLTVPSGNPAAVRSSLEQAEVAVTLSQHYPRVACSPIEGIAGLVVPHGDRVLVHINSQMPALTHDELANTLALPDDRISVVIPPIGGGFGGKCWGENGLFAVAAQLARHLSRPLRLVQSRPENLLSMQARDQDQSITLAADQSGTVTALVAEVSADVGGYAGMGAFEPLQTQRLLPGPYRIDQVAVTASAVMTNTAPTGPYRGPGRAEAIGLLERAMDNLARALDLDPAELRRRNLLRHEDFPRQTPGELVMDEADHLGALEQALTEIGYPSLREEQAARRASEDHRLLGIGLSCWADFTGRHEPCQPASARVTDDGRIEVDAGTAPIGQGMQTVVTRLAAETLGLDPAYIVAATPDTGRFRSALGSFGSRSASLAGSSAVQVAEQLLDQLKKQAADLLEAAVDDIELRSDATLGVRGTPSASIALTDLAGTEATAAFDQGQPTFSGGTHVAVVEIDTETGNVDLIRHVAVTDCGRVLSEMQASGQVQGGAVQGIAVALFEEMRYDADANPLTVSLADYLVPAASDVPPVETHFIETPTDRNPLGAKGVAESGAIAAPPAVQNAIVDALSHLGVTHIDMPCTPERIWQALRAATERR